MADLSVDLSKHEISVSDVLRNPSPAVLYETAIRHEPGSAMSRRGALVAMSGEKTGRSPKDKRIVEHPDSKGDIWWGDINIKLDPEIFSINRQRAVDYLNTRPRLFVIDGFAGADPRYQLKIRVICERAYHALFMHNMLIRPSAEQLQDFGDPDFVIYNAGRFPANRHTATLTSKTSVDISLEDKQMVILGTEYAGEMKKGVFTVMNYLLPKEDVLSMHCSATEGDNGKTTIFFGMSGTGKTTLSADPNRALIGDDEHGWTNNGVFNIEGGCYAKAIDLCPQEEPQIYNAIRFGAVLENVAYDPLSRKVDYHDTSITANTRASYPIEFMPAAKQPSTGGLPDNVIFLTCDAFGVLPPVSQLTTQQAMEYFINGYTAKIPGTEVGVQQPQATFSPCFAAPFLVWPPKKYAKLLADQVEKHNVNVWLVNTGWTGGDFTTAKRMSLKHTRAVVDAINSGALAKSQFEKEPCFDLLIPKTCPNVPDEILNPRHTWADKQAYDKQARQLANSFKDNLAKFA